MILNPSQKRAVEADEKLVVVMSGPGSGKTRVAVERVKRLKSKSIVVLTFTNAAAREFRNRVMTESVAGIRSVSEVQRLEFCGTLHSYCFRLIRQFGRLIGYGHGNVALLPESDSKALFKQIEARLKDSEERILDEYYFTLKQNNLVDYDRILRDGLRLLQFNEVRAAVRIEHLIIEEAQDSAEIDWQIYAAIPADNRFVIGDVDQAIFEFRQAYPAGFLALANTSASTVIKLEENYRCAKVICEAANKLIRCNESRYEKDTISATGETGSIVVRGFGDAWEELTHVSRLLTADAKLGIAVLFRTNHELNRAYNFFYAAGLVNIFRADEREAIPADWRRALLTVGLAASPYNEVIAQQLLCLEHDPVLVADWKLEAQATGTYLSDRLPKYDPRIGILKWLAICGIEKRTIGLIEERTRVIPQDAQISDLLQDLYSGEQFRRAPTQDSVFIGTIHSAKGREFDVVFLPAFEETKMNEQNIEEERRLAFVAVTRARSALHISYAQKRTMKWGDIVEAKPSRFIGEMGL
jgi:superfamily I DNA/RNA helicase